MQDYEKYVELLKEARNVVLTGAPGTGKTYMAHEIAKKMGAITKFVQFHPSYDYTDFVEGLRPVAKSDGQIGFERKDGVFKAFCKEAMSKSSNSLWAYDKLIEDIESGAIRTLRTKTKETAQLIVKQGKIYWYSDGETGHISSNCVSRDRLADLYQIIDTKDKLDALDKVDDIRKIIKGCDSTYYWAVLNHVLTAETDTRPYVFIIDEINRGEASKIFGELFFAIDPGYRGKKEFLVQTQYQNLVRETDEDGNAEPFYDGFYVPENVYILATMNDIDRSVESMDFAMRRRFTWKEVRPSDTEDMLETLPCAKKAKSVMHSLNTAIAETIGLGPAYMIGPSYFLKLGDNDGNFQVLWERNIEPLLKEYLRGFRKSEETLASFKEAFFLPDDSDFISNSEQVDEN